MLFPGILRSIPYQVDEDGSGEIAFGEFCQLCATFLVEDPDIETMKKELKDAFRWVEEQEGDDPIPRVYDKEGQGFITTETLRGLICETVYHVPFDRRILNLLVKAT